VSKPPVGWYKLDAGYFSIYAPPGWKFQKLQGIEDSYIGEFVVGVWLEFEYGRWSSPLDEAHEPEYMVAHESIGGYRAKIVSPSLPGRGISGIYFPKTKGGNKLCLYGQNLRGPQQELTLKIFRTIRFGVPQPQ
jgi:hypothetical protein